jgi:hypothetical protein
MGIELLTERLKDQIAGVLGCWDRILIFGTLPKICYAEGMTSYLYAKQVRIFDYPKFAEPFRERLRENAEHLAAPSVKRRYRRQHLCEGDSGAVLEVAAKAARIQSDLDGRPLPREVMQDPRVFTVE